MPRGALSEASCSRHAVRLAANTEFIKKCGGAALEFISRNEYDFALLNVANTILQLSVPICLDLCGFVSLINGIRFKPSPQMRVEVKLLGFRQFIHYL